MAGETWGCPIIGQLTVHLKFKHTVTEKVVSKYELAGETADLFIRSQLYDFLKSHVFTTNFSDPNLRLKNGRRGPTRTHSDRQTTFTV